MYPTAYNKAKSFDKTIKENNTKLPCAYARKFFKT
jgi:hypothetical protein